MGREEDIKKTEMMKKSEQGSSQAGSSGCMIICQQLLTFCPTVLNPVIKDRF